mmetsp:Transcript_23302/g.68827  ORF Transcript_23302/g.68827 Transcript_23302/m.68827 type:complete len:113 (-) Transcript_23302:93-431(-)
MANRREVSNFCRRRGSKEEGEAAIVPILHDARPIVFRAARDADAREERQSRYRPRRKISSAHSQEMESIETAVNRIIPSESSELDGTFSSFATAPPPGKLFRTAKNREIYIM